APTLRLWLAAPQGGVFTLGRPGGKKNPHASPLACAPPRGLHAARIRQAHSRPQWTAVCPGSSPRGLFTGGAEPWGGPAVKKSPPNFGGLYAGPGPDELHHAHQDQTKQLLG